MDATRAALPNLVYVSREKNRAFHHNFKAGALNALVSDRLHQAKHIFRLPFNGSSLWFLLQVRVSGVMSNGQVVLTLDCDMFSNDPQTAQRALCYLLDPAMAPKLAYVQFPQRFRGIDENDIYANEHKRFSHVHPTGMNGLRGPMYLGTGCFFSRRALHGPSSPLYSVADDQDGLADGSSSSAFSEASLRRAHQVASCRFDHETGWGTTVMLPSSLSDNSHRVFCAKRREPLNLHPN